MESFVAIRTFPYAGRTLQPGEIFEPVSAYDATLLTLAGHAVLASAVDNQAITPALPVTPTRPVRRRAKAARVED